MIYVFLAPGFEEIEALATVDVLRRAGEQVVTVGVSEKIIKGSHNISVVADTTIAEVRHTQADMLVLPGGMPGTLNLEACEPLKEMLAEAYRNEKWLAAICAAPSVFGHMGFLQGRSATCYPGFEKDLFGAQYTAQRVCRDGHIVTANGAGSAIAFGLELVRVLQGDEVASNLAAAMQC